MLSLIYFSAFCSSLWPAAIKPHPFYHSDVSPFIRDLNRSPELDSIVSSFAGESVVAHSMPSNYSHVNIGEPNSGLPVDRWHVDSVDFVLIVLLSDPENMEGGELQVVANHEPDEALRLLEQHNGSPPAQYIRSVKIPAAGWAVMMQGSKIAHHVTEVTKGPEVSQEPSP